MVIHFISQLRRNVQSSLVTSRNEYFFFYKKVVSHLQGSHGCRLDEALRIVQNANHKDAEAVMLEKLGNYEEAFKLLLKKLQESLATVIIFFNLEVLK